MSRPFWFPDLQTTIACTLLFLFGAALYMLLFKPMPMTEAAGTLLTAMVGMLVAKIGTMVDFYFGSSTTSKQKDDTIQKLVEHPNP